jgi:hypothetical protein
MENANPLGHQTVIQCVFWYSLYEVSIKRPFKSLWFFTTWEAQMISTYFIWLLFMTLHHFDD